MPELPEVETIRRQLSPQLCGRTISMADSHPSPKFAPAREAAGARVEALDRRGKYLVASLDDDRELVLHLGMTGSLRVHPGPTGDPFVRASWWLDGGGVLELRDVRRFGRVAVVPRGEYTALPTLAALGPEPLAEDFTAEGLYRALRGSGRRVKTQLLSQRPVAGVGNIYADEALWDAGIHPARRRVSRVQAVRLHAAIRTAIEAGIRNGGTTLRDYVDGRGEAGANQWHLRCYGRAGEPCERCGLVLERIVVDARGTTICGRCQRR